MLTQLRIFLVSVTLILFGITTVAQSTCSDLVTRALETTRNNCAESMPNTVCYGNGLIFAQARSDIALTFANEGDIAPIDAFTALTHSPLDEETQMWGVSLMSLRANIPDSSPGQVVQIIVFGNVEVSDVQQSAFRFTTGIGAPTCAEAPSSGLMVRTPEGIAEITLNINEVDISMGSTALIEANEEEGMTVTMLDGAARVTAQGVTQPVSFSQQINIPMMRVDENLVPVAPPSPAETWDAAKISRAFAVYNTLNALGIESSVVDAPLSTATQPVVIVTATPAATLVPTLTLTPSPTFTPIPCTITTTSTDVLTRVGPGYNRGTFIYLEPNTPISVTGKKTVNDLLWWQLDKFQVSSGASSVNELWVAESDVTEQGDCDQVIDVDAPPIVRLSPTPPPQPTSVPTDVIQPTSDIVPAVEPYILLSIEDDEVMMGECTTVYVTIEYISAGYFDGPGFVGDTTIEGPEWETSICPPENLGTYTYTLDAYSLTGNLVQRFVSVEVN